MGCKPTVVRQWTAVLKQWQRAKTIDNSKINYKIFEWCERSMSQRCKNWNIRINSILRNADITLDNICDYRVIKYHIASFLFGRFKIEWLGDVNR